MPKKKTGKKKTGKKKTGIASTSDGQSSEVDESLALATSTMKDMVLSEEKKYTLTSSDGQSFEVGESAAMMSSTVKHMIEDDCADTEIPIANVTGKVLEKVVVFCQKHVDEAKKKKDDDWLWGHDVKAAKELKEWTKGFVDVDQAMLFDMLLAANYLDIKEMLDVMLDAIADLMRGKTPEQIRETFHIVNDYTPEEEARVREENSWAFE